jgi:purine-binding chemotaxis protein CheW
MSAAAELPDSSNHALRQVLSFRVGAGEYAIDILQVHEIRGQSAVTAMPRTAAWVRGAMNLRGNIVPIIDVKTRFGLAPEPAGGRPVIVVVALGERLVGLLVDAVCDVIELPLNAIEPAPEVQRDADFVEALVRHADRLLILLNVQKLID